MNMQRDDASLKAKIEAVRRGMETALAAAEQKLRDAAPQEGKGQWVSVKERLPKVAGEYFAYSSTGYRTNLAFKPGKGWMETIDRNDYHEEGYWDTFITHWQPLPLPPKDDDRSGIAFWLPKSKERRVEMAQAFEAIAAIFRNSPTSGLD